MRLEVIHGSRVVPKAEQQALLIGVSERMRHRGEQSRLARRLARVDTLPQERRSVERAILAVEEQIVKAMWTIARQPLGKVAPLAAKRNGLEYMNEDTDAYSIYRDAPGGKWDSIAPRPALPSSKEISSADRVQQWLLLVEDERLRKLLVVGATNKRGDAGRQINWERVRPHLQEWSGYTLRTLKGQYREALRIIANELTLAEIGR